MDVRASTGESKIKFIYDIFHTKLGWVGIAATDKGINKITLPRTSAAEVRACLNTGNGYVQDKSEFIKLKEDIACFLRGEEVVFDVVLDMSFATEFRKKVWEAAMEIPYGCTISYSELAMRLGEPNSTRAVGSALGANPFPMVIPCHRVIAKNGALGGYSGGIELKAQLLTLEKRL